MLKPRDFINALESTDASALNIDERGGALLLHLLVHMFFADDHLDDKELDILQRLVGETDRAALRGQVEELNALPMNYPELAKAYPDRQDRLDIITLAEHGFWADNQMEFGEMDVLDQLAEALDVKDR